MNKKYQQKHKLYEHDVMQMVNAFFLIEIQVRQWYDFFNLQYSIAYSRRAHRWNKGIQHQIIWIIFHVFFQGPFGWNIPSHTLARII